MAIDEAIFLAYRQGLVPPTIRFYGWENPAISIGYTQNPRKDLELENIKKNNIQLVRRLTGGSSVLHQDELTYSIVKNLSNKAQKRIFEDYKLINLGLAIGLNKAGIRTELHKLKNQEKQKTKNAASCLTSTSLYEVKVKNKKIAGSAQRRYHNFLLQQGFIICSNSNKKLINYLRDNKNYKHSNDNINIKIQTTSIKELLAGKIDILKLIKYLLLGFKEVLNIEIISGKLTNYEKRIAQSLRINKYNNHHWTFDRLEN